MTIATMPTRGEGETAKGPLTARGLFPGRLTISPTEFARATGVGRTAVYEAIRRQEIPSRKVGERIVIPVAALDRWLGATVG